jgi:hypothetical protein
METMMMGARQNELSEDFRMLIDEAAMDELSFEDIERIFAETMALVRMSERDEE